MSLKYQVNEDKALEALVYVAGKWPGITAFFAAKVLFLAEFLHMNRYGRPIIADDYIAMEDGPVPSRIRDFIQGNYRHYFNVEDVDGAIHVDRKQQYPPITAVRAPHMDVFSKSDLLCIDEAIAEFRSKSFDEVWQIVHQNPAYRATARNKQIDYADFVLTTNPNRERILSEASEYAGSLAL